MSIYELLKSAASVCNTLEQNGANASDVRYLSMYEDWVRLRNEGHKYDFIVHYLSTQYDISRSSVERITRRMSREVIL